MKLRSYFNYLNLVIGLLLIGGNLFSQEVEPTTYLRLQKKKTEIKFFPDTNILYRWQVDNTITIISTNEAIKIKNVRGLNMDVKKRSNNVYSLYPHYSDTMNYEGGKVFVYIENARGKEQMHTLKEYKFVNPEMPIISIGGVTNDSVIKRNQLVNGYLKASHKNTPIKVLAYTLEYTLDGSEKTVIEISDQFPIHVRNAFRKLDEGSMIQFKNVKVMLSSGYIETIPIISFYLEED